MNFAIASTPARTGIETFERILAADSGLVVLDSPHASELIEQFRAIARQSGQAVYLWERDVGLSSLREAHARVPDCGRLDKVLRYMQESMHFGVFFLLGVALPLTASDARHLRQLARAPKRHLRRVVLLNPPTALAAHLGDLAAHLSGSDGQPRRLRLRDGRWLA